MKSLAVWGTGGCARSIMPLARASMSTILNPFDLVFIDDNPTTDVLNGHLVMTFEEWLSYDFEERFINVAIANPNLRASIVNRCVQHGIDFFKIHASNIMEFDSITIGVGSILSPFVTIGSNVVIGNHFHANLYSYVEHDCIVGDYVTFAPGVKCNGNVWIEDYAYVGAGAIIKQGTPLKPVVIGRGAVVGMGSVVTKSVPAGATVIGNPARLHDASTQ